MKTKHVWTVYYGKPARGIVLGPAKRPGQVRIRVARGRAKVLVEHSENAVDLYPSERSALASQRHIASERLRGEVVRAKLTIAGAVKDACDAIKYNRREIQKARAGLRAAERAVRKARRGRR